MPRVKSLILILILSFSALSLVQAVTQFSKNTAFYNEYKNEYESEFKRNLELKTKMKTLQDVDEFEKIARDKLNLTRKNEYIIVIPEPTPTKFVPTPTKVPNYRLWWGVISGSDPE